MTKETFEASMQAYHTMLGEIQKEAHRVHEAVNQKYDGTLPYGHHLDMVAEEVRRYGHEVCAAEYDVLPLFFGAWFHDSIEDARLSYNDVRKTARRWMDEEQALMAAEIVYALTNEKGRTRAERAGEKYYAGIRETPYAPFVKLCDRMANFLYSMQSTREANSRMRMVYSREMPDFLEGITSSRQDDRRFRLSEELVDSLLAAVNHLP